MRTHNGISTEESIPYGDARSGYACGSLSAVAAACDAFQARRAALGNAPDGLATRPAVRVAVNKKTGRTER